MILHSGCYDMLSRIFSGGYFMFAKVRSLGLFGLNAFPVASVMVDLAPADTKKSGSVHDMAIFMAVLLAMRLIRKAAGGMRLYRGAVP